MIRSRTVGRVTGWLAALLGVGLGAATQAEPQSISPSAAPAEWVRYAQGATEAVTALIEAESETATRLRAYLDNMRPAPDRPTAPLILKLWVTSDGKIERIAFAPFAHPEPSQDLQSLLVGQQLPGTPPADMLLPLNIAVQIDPATPQ